MKTDDWLYRVLAVAAIFAVVGAVLLLAGCASGPVEVSVPVRVPCVDAADVPVRPSITESSVLRELPDGRLVLTIASERAALAAYAARAAPLLDGCSR